MDHHILNLQGNIKLKGNDIYDMSLKSSFPNKDTLSITIKTKDEVKKLQLFIQTKLSLLLKNISLLRVLKEEKLIFILLRKIRYLNHNLKFSNLVSRSYLH